MKRVSTITTVAWHLCVISVVCQLGCSHSTTNQTGNSQTQHFAPVLSPQKAAELAAKLANDECERLHNKRPFTAQQHAAVLDCDLYRWGRLDPGGKSGLSAVVTFRADGSQPDVRVYFSTDEN